MLKVEVTQDHINNGKCGMPGQCAVALAIRDAVDNNGYITVGWMVATYTREEDGGTYWLSPEVKTFIRRFDLALPVQPISFMLTTPTSEPYPYSD